MNGETFADRAEAEDRLERWYRSYRTYLGAIAYRMLGSAADAEDVVQDVFLSASRAAAETVRDEKAYLARMAVNRCLNLLGSASRRRESYVGEWLPDPWADTTQPLPEEEAERTESLSYAAMVLLEKLAPLERAVFVLRETMDCDYAEIASLVDKSEANCRQIYSRAKRKLGGAPALEPARPQERELVLVRRFVAAFREGRLAELAELLTENVVLTTDGGGKVRAAINPIYGRERSLALLGAMLKRFLTDARFEAVPFAGGVGVAVWQDDRLQGVFCFDWSEEDAALRNMYAIFNPDKLDRLRLPVQQPAGNRE